MKLLRLFLILIGWIFLLYAAYSNIEITPKELVKCLIWVVIIIENGIQYTILTNFEKQKEDESDN